MNKRKAALFVSGITLIALGAGFFALTGASIITIAHVIVGDALLAWGLFAKDEDADFERR